MTAVERACKRNIADDTGHTFLSCSLCRVSVLFVLLYAVVTLQSTVIFCQVYRYVKHTETSDVTMPDMDSTEDIAESNGVKASFSDSGWKIVLLFLLHNLPNRKSKWAKTFKNA